MKTPPSTAHSEGRLDAPICFITEAPDQYERMKRRPLSGPAGRLFDELIHSAGILRGNSSIISISKNTANAKQVKTWRDKNQFTEKGEAIRSDFWSRLKATNAKVYVPMGNTALTMMTSFQGITNYRGSAYIGHDHLKVIPTFNPAAALFGSYIDRYTIISDFKYAKGNSSSYNLNLKKRNMHINPRFHEIMDYLEYIDRNNKTFACDIECLWHEVSCIGFGTANDYAMCIPFFGSPHPWSEEQETEIWLAIAKIFRNPKCTAIFHNAMFDVSFLYLRNNINFNCTIHCTMNMQRILYHDFSAKLQYVTSIHTDMQYYKDERKIWSKPWVDPDVFYKYNCKDVLATFEVFENLWPELNSKPDFLWTYHETMSNFAPCLYMMARGNQLDMATLDLMKKQVTLELSDKVKEFNEACDYEILYTSPKQVMQYFYEHKGIIPYKTKGKPTSDDKAMARIHRKYDLPEARLLQECRSLRKLLGTYLEFEVDKDSRLRCFYDPRGTYTGRLSSKKTIFDTGLQYQNLDPRIKSFITADTV